jgi:zinc D-Ala-D-Ala carboxypeptidase
MQLSPHFSLEELTRSPTAARLGIDNDLPIDLLGSAKRTCEGLELVRSLLGDNPIRISSGYRCLALNSAIGSKHTSQHVKAEAVDFTCPTFGDPRMIMKAIMESDIPYHQVILEHYDGNGGGWVHISFSDTNIKQALIIDNVGTRVVDKSGNPVFV